MNVSHVVKLEQHGAKCAHRHGVICVTSGGTNILQGQIITERYASITADPESIHILLCGVVQVT